MPEVTQEITVPVSDYIEVPLPQKDEPDGQTWLNASQIETALRMEEAGDADVFTELYKNKVAYDHSEKQWYIFGKNYWERDRTGQVKFFVINNVASQYINAASAFRALGFEENAKKIKDLLSRASSLGYANRVNQVLSIARSRPEIALTGEEWHKDPLLLACSNGVINIRNGFEFREGRPEDYLRSVIPTEWRGIGEPAQRWEQFLREIFADQEELPPFIRRLFGYGLTGLASEDKFPVLWGEGRNGKDTLIGVMEKVLGNDIAAPVKSEIIVSSDRNTSNATPQIMALRNRRLVWVSETNEGARINAGQVKLLTGGGTISARPLYGKPVEFTPTHLIMLMTNHKPHTGDDEAIWKRLILVEFNQKFVDNPVLENEHKKDGFLEEKLMLEASGILAWLVRGAMEYLEKGLMEPSVVMDATKEYRSKEDVLVEFENDVLEHGETYEESLLTIFNRYKDWSEDSGYGKGMNKIALGIRLSKRYKSRHTSSGVVYQGIRVKYN